MAKKRLHGSHPIVHTVKPGAVHQVHLQQAIYDAWQDLTKRADFRNRIAIKNGTDKTSSYQIYGWDLEFRSDRFFDRAKKYIQNSTLMEIGVRFPDRIEPNHALNAQNVESIINSLISAIRKYLHISIYTYQTDSNYYLSARSVVLTNEEFFIDCIEDILNYKQYIQNINKCFCEDIISINFKPNYLSELLELSDWANFCSRHQRSNLSSNVSSALEAKAIAKAIGGVQFRKIVEPRQPRKIPKDPD